MFGDKAPPFLNNKTIVFEKRKEEDGLPFKSKFKINVTRSDKMSDDLDKDESIKSSSQPPRGEVLIGSRVTPKKALVSPYLRDFLGEGHSSYTGLVEFQRFKGSAENSLSKKYYASFYGGESLTNLLQSGKAHYKGLFRGQLI